jgi:hypothetical protein
MSAQITATEEARRLLRAGDCSTKQIAEITGLHQAYVRKIRQRDDGRDFAWKAWRYKNPETVLSWHGAYNSKRPSRSPQPVQAFLADGITPC